MRLESISTPRNQGEVRKLNLDGRLDESFCGNGESLDEKSLINSLIRVQFQTIIENPVV